ncbi:cell division protein FtsQ, partial [Desulfovibrio sp. OttesenSCG-928-A18]|nr:cell division protein FtsQ [Desulfovibrio sp. OttesenSCG-928-A18]
VLEKAPSFWVLRDNALHYADDRGEIIAPMDARGFAYLPELVIEPGAELAANALPHLVRSLKSSRLPLDLHSLSKVRLSAARGVEIEVEGSDLRLSIGLEDWLANMQRLGLTLTDLSRRGELGDVREIKAQGANVWVERHSPAPSVLAGG